MLQTPDSYGSMLELCWKGTKTIPLDNGDTRKFIKVRERETRADRERERERGKEREREREREIYTVHDSKLIIVIVTNIYYTDCIYRKEKNT